MVWNQTSSPSVAFSLLTVWTYSHRRLLPPSHRRSDLLPLPSHPIDNLRPHILSRSHRPDSRTRSTTDSNPSLPPRLSQLRHPKPLKLRLRIRNQADQHQPSRDPNSSQADGPFPRGDPRPADPDRPDVQLSQRLLSRRVGCVASTVRAVAARSGSVGKEDDRDATRGDGEAGRSR